MQRVVFDRHICDGFRNSKVESIATTNQGRKLFVGTSEGVLQFYELKVEGNNLGIKELNLYSLK
jgi:hypothetical protein